MSCCLESKVAIGSGPTVAPKKQTKTNSKH